MDEEEGVFTEVENESFFDRIGDAFAGICIGLLLFIGAFPLLWWNEGRAVDVYQAINEGRKVYVPIDASVINTVNEGALVYVTGLAEPTENITDAAFGVQVSSKTVLERNVEMYQWYEKKKKTKKKKIGGGTTTVTEYTYEKRWQPKLIDSSGFKRAGGHTNPQSMPYTEDEFYSAVTLEAFVIPTDLVGSISSPTDIGEALPVDIIPSSNLLLQNFQNVGILSYPNGFYFGNSTSSPSIGDTRVTYRSSSGGKVSILAQQEGSTFGPYEAESGASIYRLEKGIVSADAMFDNAKAENKALTMILRIVGALVMAIGIGLVLQPLAIVADIIPCIGDLVGGAIACVAGMISLVLSLLVIGIAWVFARPAILGVAVGGIVVVGIIVYSGIRRKKNAKAEEEEGASSSFPSSAPNKQDDFEDDIVVHATPI